MVYANGLNHGNRLSAPWHTYPTILEFAATEGLVVITGDRATFADFALDRIQSGKPMAGVIILRPGAITRDIVEAVAVIIDCCQARDWFDRIEFIPFG